ncbi:MAG: MFS transporter, partial [Chloroflexi bacterium]|nr:MFS transporter [Chloroflexota bacterium]
MADAIVSFFPEAKLTIGPPTEDGFYYDIDLPRPLTPDDLERIEARMRETIKADHPFECREISRDDAQRMFADNPYKLQIIDEIPSGEAITTYSHGAFTDLCEGPHVERTGDIEAVKLLNVAGAYWRGSEANPMLQRLYGTAFAVFYAIFGIPLGRLADVWDRRKLIAAGLAFWSVMTVLSGGARTFSQLAVARFGVGIGEASATPAAYSLLCDYFSVARRATALAIYSSGIYIGVGLSLFVGGQVVGYWDTAFAGAAPWGLRGWQVAFFVVGLPGVLLALVVRRIREPIRGVTEGVTRAVSLTRHPFRVFGRELLAMLLPPLHL